MKARTFFRTFLPVLIVGNVLISCGNITQGPTVWIDRPLDGSHVPLGAITIQAHASDEGGVAGIDFYYSETMLASVPTGGGRLEQAGIEWMPPEPGVYNIAAQAVDRQGNVGSRSIVQIVVGEALPPAEEEAIPAIEIPITASAEPTRTAKPTETAGPPVASGPSLTLKQNANCREGPGTAYDNIETLFQGQTVPIAGQNDQANWFWVKKPGGHGNCWVSIISVELQGNLESVPVISVAPVATQPPVQPPAQPPVQDTKPPVISQVSINPSAIQQSGCGSPDTFTISATVTDAGGIGNVTYELQGPGPQDGGEGYLLPEGGNSFRATVGPLSGSTGNWTISLSAVDMSNNHASAGSWTVQVLCIQ